VTQVPDSSSPNSGMDAEQFVRQSGPPSTMSLLGLLRSLAEVERHTAGWMPVALTLVVEIAGRSEARPREHNCTMTGILVINSGKHGVGSDVAARAQVIVIDPGAVASGDIELNDRRSFVPARRLTRP
jgi:hypothetical protein